MLARTLEAEITRALDDLPATSRYTVDVSLVHLDVTTDRAEIEARAEIYAMLSDDRGRVVWTSLSRSVARGTPADRSQLARDAVQAAAARVGRLLRRRLRT